MSSHGLSETCDAVDLDIANVASQLVVTSGVSETMVVRIPGSQIVDLDVANVASQSCDSESPILAISGRGPDPQIPYIHAKPVQNPSQKWSILGSKIAHFRGLDPGFEGPSP